MLHSLCVQFRDIPAQWLVTAQVATARLDAILRRGGAPSEVFAPELPVGDYLVYDQRTVHRGVPNTSGIDRPILYLLFARPWFKEHLNFGPTSLFADSVPAKKKKRRRRDGGGAS